MSPRRQSSTTLLALLTLPLTSLAQQGQFLRSTEELADPRGYCLDIPGFGSRMQLDAPIYTHSCKYSLPGFDVDEIFAYTDGKLEFVNYDRCLAAKDVGAGAEVFALRCDAAHAWQIDAQGRVSPVSATELCLTLAAERVFVNSGIGTVPPYSSRPVSLEPCAQETAYRQRWRWSAPDERVTYNANSLRSEIPPAIQIANREIGTRIDGAATRTIYRDVRREFSAADVIVSGEIAYGPDERQRLKAYAGKNRNSPGGAAPVIVLVHGGGFTGGSLQNLEHAAMQFAGVGFVAVNITYPLAPEHTWPSGAASLAAAVDWVRANIAEYRGNAEQIFLLGHSAGANHVANFVMRPSLTAASRPAVAGAILASPALEPDQQAPADAFGGYFHAVPWPQVSLLNNIENASVPVLVTVAEFDPAPLQNTAARFFALLTNEHNAMPRFRQIPGHGHISYISAIGTGDRLFMEEALDFLLTGR